MKVGIILTPDNRSKAYIQKLLNHKITLDEIIFMNDKQNEIKYSKKIIKKSLNEGFDISIPVSKTLLEHNIQFKEFNFVNINHHELINYIKNISIDYFLFTGGGILKKDILHSGSKFVHFHPGIVPNYRGSTCFYYSILNDDNCGVTAFVMDKELDTGNIITQKIFPKPDHPFIDEVYDAHIRSETLIEVLQNNLLSKNHQKQKNSIGETYFIIHPILKHIAILNCIKN
jgi:methionyl-tRNA formyltransferase